MGTRISVGSRHMCAGAGIVLVAMGIALFVLSVERSSFSGIAGLGTPQVLVWMAIVPLAAVMVAIHRVYVRFVPYTVTDGIVDAFAVILLLGAAAAGCIVTVSGWLSLYGSEIGMVPTVVGSPMLGIGTTVVFLGIMLLVWCRTASTHGSNFRDKNDERLRKSAQTGSFLLLSVGLVASLVGT